MRRALVLAAAGLSAPSTARACTWCISSAYGDQTFNWAYLGLIVAPFLVAAAITAVLVYYYRPPRGARATRLASPAAAAVPHDAHVSGSRPPEIALPHPLEKETP